MPSAIYPKELNQDYVALMEGAGMVYNHRLKRWVDPTPAAYLSTDTGRKMDTHPKDKGCHLAPKCLDCPLPICEEDRRQEKPHTHPSDKKNAQYYTEQRLIVRDSPYRHYPHT